MRKVYEKCFELRLKSPTTFVSIRRSHLQEPLTRFGSAIPNDQVMSQRQQPGRHSSVRAAKRAGNAFGVGPKMVND
jgi:hypothetical protein